MYEFEKEIGIYGEKGGKLIRRKYIRVNGRKDVINVDTLMLIHTQRYGKTSE